MPNAHACVACECAHQRVCGCGHEAGGLVVGRHAVIVHQLRRQREGENAGVSGNARRTEARMQAACVRACLDAEHAVLRHNAQCGDAADQAAQLRARRRGKRKRRERTLTKAQVNATQTQRNTHTRTHTRTRTHHGAGLCAQLRQADHLARAHAEGGARAAACVAAAATTAFALLAVVAAHAHGGGAAVLRERKVEHVLLKHLRLGRVAARGRGPPGGGAKMVSESASRASAWACVGVWRAHLAALMQKTICLR